MTGRWGAACRGGAAPGWLGACGCVLLLVSALPLAAVTDRPYKPAVAELAPAAAGADVTFVVGGDNRPTAKGAPQPRLAGTIFDEIGLLRPNLVIWSGDTIYGYCDTPAELDNEYDAFLTLARRGATPFFNAPGNHEVHPDEACPAASGPLCDGACMRDAFARRFGPLYGSFDYAGVHFIALDTQVPGEEEDIAGEQLAWLRRDLESNKEARAIFVFLHVQMYTSQAIDPAEGRDHQSVAGRALLHDLFRRYPVRAVFAGHEHLFWHDPPEQHDFLDYFISAGGGAPPYASVERGGIAHYLLVHVTGDRVTYDVIQPGRLYVEPAAMSGPAEARAWLVNSNSVGGLTLGGIDLAVPAAVGACADLTVTTDLRRFNGQRRDVPIEVVSCTAGGAANQLHLRATGVPRGASVPIVVRRRSPAAAPAGKP